ncbi:MAG TPA: hypothetical protein VGJ81_21595 [Thermoanaerobaculia bacterium]|jgi:hypothetical protein
MAADLESFAKAACELLDSRGVRDIDGYGWLNLEEMDPDFSGYVMWVQVPPYDHDFMNWQRNIPPERAPTKEEQALMELGHDFFGFMKTARHFIGHALLYQPQTPPKEIDPTEFDFSEFAALTALVAAADRLRDFVIMALLGKNTRKWRALLEESYRQLKVMGFDVLVTELRAGFCGTERARTARNIVVHRLATKPARVQRKLIARDRVAFEAQSWGKPARGTYGEQVAGWQRRINSAVAKIERRAKLLCDTYSVLAKLGEVSIRAEYYVRQRRSTTSG